MTTLSYTDSTAVTASSGNVAAATATATLTATTGRTMYISGFSITGGGATGASIIQPTITGVVGGTMTFTMGIPAGATVGATPLIVNFHAAVPASAPNTNIVVSAPSFGAGNTNATVVAYGYLK
jgi:hypothetical protein